MTPKFTNVNLVLNTLNDFLEKKFAFDFSESLSESEDSVFLYSPKEYVQTQVEDFDSILELAEGEITQTIFAGNTILINSLFQYIKSQREYVYPKPDFLLQKIHEWNRESYTKYEKNVFQKTTAYFSNDKFIGLKHLDTFEDYVPESPFDFTHFKKTARIYYAYYCIEDKWKEQFDLKHFDSYLKLVNEQVDKLVTLFDKYIVRYDAGEFTKGKEEKKILLQRLKNRAENNPFVVGFIILTAVLTIFAGIKKDALELFFNSPESKNTVQTDTLVKSKTTGKLISGIIVDEQKKALKGVSVKLKGSQTHTDSTDSFGRFFLSNLTGNGWSTENIILSRNGFPDSVLSIKVDYGSPEPLHFEEIIFKKSPGKTDQQLCEQGDAEACYRFARTISKSCPTNEGSARTACIFRTEMWRAVGDDYNDVLIAKRDSGATSSAYKEAKQRWIHQIEMARAMPESY